MTSDFDFRLCCVLPAKALIMLLCWSDSGFALLKMVPSCLDVLETNISTKVEVYSRTVLRFTYVGIENVEPQPLLYDQIWPFLKNAWRPLH